MGRRPAHGQRSSLEKVLSIEDLGSVVETLKQSGETVAMCHGVFDLLHLGHVRHMENARKEGSILVVTITADRFVNKGPGRPVFPEAIRAEMLANLTAVDYVGIVHEPTAIGAIQTIKPNIYVKGSDYQNSSEDVTGKIVDEQNAVEGCGGNIVFTDDITFSSSALINQHMDVYDPELREFLAGVRQTKNIDHFSAILDRVKDMRVLVVGDTIIDEYRYVVPLAKAPKENMIATHYQGKEVFAGGVIAAANHLASICKEVEVITCLGREDSHEDLVRESLRPNVRLTDLKRLGKPTTRKVRFIEPGYMRKLFEVYHMDDTPLDGWEAKTLNGMIEGMAADYDLVVVTDFGHGLIGQETVDTLIGSAKFLAVNTQSNSGNLGFNLISKYHKADFICIDAPEARLATQDRYSDISEITETKLRAIVNCPDLIVTHGRYGCVTQRAREEVRRIPAFTTSVVDTVGAGDAFFAITAPLVAAGAQLEDAGFIGNAAGAIKVGIVGHRDSVEKVPLIKYITTLLK